MGARGFKAWTEHHDGLNPRPGVRLRKPARQELLDLAPRLTASFGEQRLGVVIPQVHG